MRAEVDQPRPRMAEHVRCTQNFVTLDFEGALNDRKMLIRYWDSNGKLLNQKPGADPGTPTDLSVIHAKHLIPKNL